MLFFWGDNIINGIIMKKLLYAIVLLLGMGIMVSCGDGLDKIKHKEPSNTEKQSSSIDTSSSNEPNASTKLFNESELVGAEDTVKHNGYWFASYPIPDTVKARMQGKSMKENANIGYDQLRYLTLPYYDFDGHVQKGELVCNKAIAHDLLYIFRDLFSEQYPICSIRLVDDFDADDETSMQANNTSCFNYRNVPGTSSLSRHALGLAIDINPLQNPYVKGSRIYPSTATEYVDRTKDFPHKIDDDDFCKKVFISYGFTWGGNWNYSKDYQHFEKKR